MGTKHDYGDARRPTQRRRKHGFGQTQTLTVSDAEAIRSLCKYVSMVSPMVSASGQTVHGNNNSVGSIRGGGPDILTILQI